MIRFGISLRRRHLQFLRVTPTFEVTAELRRRFLVAAYVVGRTGQGGVDAPETVTVRLTRTRLHVIGDEPGQDW